MRAELDSSWNKYLEQIFYEYHPLSSELIRASSNAKNTGAVLFSIPKKLSEWLRIEGLGPSTTNSYDISSLAY